MTREEEIINAAREYNNGITFSNPSNVLHFEAGAKWADKNPDLSSLWHDASEEPKGTYIVLCDGLDNSQWVVDYSHIDMAYANWKDYAETIEVIRWAYISDLLPKGGEQ